MSYGKALRDLLHEPHGWDQVVSCCLSRGCPSPWFTPWTAAFMVNEETRLLAHLQDRDTAWPVRVGRPSSASEPWGHWNARL